jgi:hypothetical protein
MWFIWTGSSFCVFLKMGPHKAQITGLWFRGQCKHYCFEFPGGERTLKQRSDFFQCSSVIARLWIHFWWPEACSLSTMPHHVLITICWTELNQNASLVRDLLSFRYHTQMGKSYFWYLIQKKNRLATSLESRPACCTKVACGLDGSFWSPITLHPGNDNVYHKKFS